MESTIIATEREQAQPTADSLQLALAAARTAADNRGRDVVVLDMRKMTPLFDYFVLATGNSRRQLHAISEEIDHTLEQELGDKRLSIEGYQESHWIILDYGNVVVHLFDQTTRDYYSLEQLWARSTRVPHPWANEGPEADAGVIALPEADAPLLPDGDDSDPTESPDEALWADDDHLAADLEADAGQEDLSDETSSTDED